MTIDKNYLQAYECMHVSTVSSIHCHALSSYIYSLVYLQTQMESDKWILTCVREYEQKAWRYSMSNEKP
jgi:hypothetical protein